MRIKSNAILAGVVIILGIITFVGGVRYIFDSNPTYANAIGGSMLGRHLSTGIVTIRDDLLRGKPVEEKEEDEERKV